MSGPLGTTATMRRLGVSVFMPGSGGGIQGPQGEQGVQGPQGTPGTSFVPRGLWAPGLNYHFGDIVSHFGNFYVALNDHLSASVNAPPDPAFWTPITTGPQGPQGPAGRGVNLLGQVVNVPGDIPAAYLPPELNDAWLDGNGNLWIFR